MLLLEQTEDLKFLFLEFGLSVGHPEAEVFVVLHELHEQLTFVQWLLLRVTLLLSVAAGGFLPKFADNLRNDADQLSLYTVVHVQNKRDVLAAVGALYGDAKQQLP